MPSILRALPFAVNEKLKESLRRCRLASVRIRYLIVLNLLHGRPAYETAEVLGVHNTTFYRVAGRFRVLGEAGLWDPREDNGNPQLDDRYLAVLYQVVRGQPKDYGWRRPTREREFLVETLVRQTRIRVHVATMWRALVLIKARGGCPRPTARCPWAKAAKTRRLTRIWHELDTLPRSHVAVYEDEVDSHLNLKRGPSWMVQGQQKEVATPGQNRKRYLAGALDGRPGQLHWVEGLRKVSDLLIALLHSLQQVYAQARVIPLVLDNYRIRDSKIVHAALAGIRERIVLHFLPPNCPQNNKIEPVWEDLHGNVARNYTCPTMTKLM